jgi:hypothetical protein
VLIFQVIGQQLSVAVSPPAGMPMATAWRPGSASVRLEEAQQMTGTIHVADDQGDTTHTWDTTDPRTIRAIEELFQQAQATGRLVYRQTSDGSGHQLRLAGWNPAEHTELFVAPRLAGG